MNPLGVVVALLYQVVQPTLLHHSEGISFGGLELLSMGEEERRRGEEYRRGPRSTT